MNKKLQKVLDEIEKTETKIAQWQEHLKMLLVQKKQLEDTEINIHSRAKHGRIEQ